MRSGAAISIALVFLLFQGMAHGQDSLDGRVLINFDIFGSGVSVASGQRDYDPFNPWAFQRYSLELEYALPKAPGISLTADGEWFETETAAGPVEVFGSESGKPSRFVKIQSLTFGFRKYFFAKGSSAPQGLFGEFQVGYGQERIDTVHRFLTSEPVIDDYSDSDYLAFRGRAGFQMIFGNRLAVSPSVMLDFRRLLRKDDWFRVLIAELNIGIVF